MNRENRNYAKPPQFGCCKGCCMGFKATQKCLSHFWLHVPSHQTEGNEETDGSRIWWICWIQFSLRLFSLAWNMVSQTKITDVKHLAMRSFQIHILYIFQISTLSLCSFWFSGFDWELQNDLSCQTQAKVINWLDISEPQTPSPQLSDSPGSMMMIMIKH